jgi:glyoxylase-like metal-dependent hydrolase (beta-lactamase superfamily II)
MHLYSVPGNTYKLDGGAMFGNAPKVVWDQWIPADEQNRISLATRALLVVTRTEKILFETGIGAYMDPKLRSRYGVDEPGNMLVQALALRGISQEEITRIFISHLHFDHAGGLLSDWQAGREPELLFPNAKVYVGESAWERAIHPHPRDRASYIPRLHQQLEESKRMVLVDKDEVFNFDGLELRFFTSEGHSPGLLSADLRFGNERLVYASDLIPGRFWVHLPITMGYDRYPELLINEKKALLTSLLESGGMIFYSHDPDYVVSSIKADEEHNTFTVVANKSDLALDSDHLKG